MKINIILAVLVVVASYFTCKNFKKTDVPPAATSETPAPPNQYSNSGYNWKASHVIEGNNPDTAFSYQTKQAPAYVDVPWKRVPAPSTSRRAYMSTDWWVPKFAFQGSDTTVHVNYITKTLKFNEDQSFEIHEKGKQVEKGNWAFDEDQKILYLACKNTYFNNTWRVRENGFRMVLLGNTDINVTGIQVRLDGSKTPPSN
ncbi:MAG: hypothetical protein JNJ57_21030 [Saprospiraceae bacterium]|nr:hypothetical protein [Saprospiraceae bacterium]